MGLRQRLELRSESAELGTEGGRLSNKDMDPVPMGSPERTWGWPSLLGFWIAEAFSISMYQGAIVLLFVNINSLRIVANAQIA